MKKLIILLSVLSVLFFISALWWTNGLKAPNPQDKKPKIFVINQGDSVREIINKLKKEDLIKDPIVFFLLTKRLELDKKIQAGDFRLNRSMNAGQIAENLIRGRLDIWVTIPEGERAEEIADRLEKNLPSYETSWRKTLNDNEGYLFPDTYLIPKDADINLVLSLMKNNFRNKYDSIKNLKTSKFSDEDIVIIASLIEREAKFEKDRPLVASVIVNRLGQSMALQIDATVQYALGYEEKRWWRKNLTKEDLKINSSYNTYTFPGLPPTPIANPGLSALIAALNPTSTNYLYYVSDKDGKLHFSETLKGHNENIRKYL